MSLVRVVIMILLEGHVWAVTCLNRNGKDSIVIHRVCGDITPICVSRSCVTDVIVLLLSTVLFSLVCVVFTMPVGGAR
jgi:hypothetical protein